ncbi:TonB-dependent receptor plug domain-containing protein [Seonamhaeicola marinus]|uniref:TonB-dependent receptor plug domain-containing protein n=2 Tax=Seonamhaeicola marinus TaxID=1912246 RepID=A0A5D0HUP2_9FLAO|nr:TonB-dependent receptor plug domain-containing protein [Seonamhaeicola marinus]
MAINIDKALMVVDDKIANKKTIDSIPFKQLVGLKFLKADDEKALKYGNAAKNGVVLIQTNKPFLDFLKKNKSLLFVLDGRPVSSQVIANIHPSKIKSVDILKEKASTAIYGSRGANGAVLITLKKTKKN